MRDQMIDIGQFRAAAKAGQAAPRVRFAQAGSPVAVEDSRRVAFVFNLTEVCGHGAF